jgi:hypothetical protein
MTYSKTNWADRSVQYPNRFIRTSDGTYDTLTPSPGTITQSGTPITATALNNMENGIYNNDVNKANRTQEAWHDLVLIEGWVNTDPGAAQAQYMKDEFGFVHLKGFIQNGNTAAGSWICSPLPVGYRPPDSRIYTTYTAYGTNYYSNACLQFNSDGTIVVWANVLSGQLSLHVPLFQGV